MPAGFRFHLISARHVVASSLWLEPIGAQHRHYIVTHRVRLQTLYVALTSAEIKIVEKN
jgi:hypothetical protein